MRQATRSRIPMDLERVVRPAIRTSASNRATSTALHRHRRRPPRCHHRQRRRQAASRLAHRSNNSSSRPLCLRVRKSLARRPWPNKQPCSSRTISNRRLTMRSSGSHSPSSRSIHRTIPTNNSRPACLATLSRNGRSSTSSSSLPRRRNRSGNARRALSSIHSARNSARCARESDEMPVQFRRLIPFLSSPQLSIFASHSAESLGRLWPVFEQ